MRPILFVLAWVYFMGLLVAAIYENWVYFVEQGFLAWLFFGEIVATFRALDWPLDVYQAWM